MFCSERKNTETTNEEKVKRELGRRKAQVGYGRNNKARQPRHLSSIYSMGPDSDAPSSNQHHPSIIVYLPRKPLQDTTPSIDVINKKEIHSAMPLQSFKES